LRKRDGFRAAFEGFDPDRVAAFGERDVERLVADASIIRHRGKIEAAIANARATVELRGSEPLQELFWSYARATVELRGSEPLQELFWSYAPGTHGTPASAADWHASTLESVALSKRLKQAGFRFVGPTTVYASMQACGVVNDHLAACWVRAAVEAQRMAAVAT
jgi:DNA-3-methyladenine glycosylase I